MYVLKFSYVEKIFRKDPNSPETLLGNDELLVPKIFQETFIENIRN